LSVSAKILTVTAAELEDSERAKTALDLAQYLFRIAREKGITMKPSKEILPQPDA